MRRYSLHENILYLRLQKYKYRLFDLPANICYNKLKRRSRAKSNLQEETI